MAAQYRSALIAAPGTDPQIFLLLRSFVSVTESQDLLENKLEEILSLPVTSGPGAALDAGLLVFSNPCLEEMPAVRPDAPPAYEDVAVRLNNVETNNAAPPVRLNINVNKQEDPVKLMEKCLNNMVEAPASAPIWLPTDIKSNILKAQVEAGHKMIRDDAGISHVTVTPEEASPRSVTVKVANRPMVQECPEREPPTLQQIFITNFGSQELKESNHDNPAMSSALPPADETSHIKSATDDLDALLASLTENLIDLTEAPPPQVTPPLVPSYTAIAPRWLVPGGVVSNGHLGAEASLPAKVLNNVTDSPSPAAETLDVQVPASAATPKEVTRPRCLLTTEL